MSATLQAVLPKAQLTRLENFEMEQFRRLNEEVLDDETNPELLDVARNIFAQLEVRIEEYRVLAKKKGFKFKATKKEDA